MLQDCSPERAADLQQRARAPLDPCPAAAEVEKVLSAGAERVDGGREPLASWLSAARPRSARRPAGDGAPHPQGSRVRGIVSMPTIDQFG
ncbi:hypothetical protein ACFYXC_13295 [Streptomyces sp. NPDC002701]|uniref:hypothetical protein n=1 Tax=Streptomyces sp. NPDC002701 TaxID=3364661 RepID=UPI0036B82D15